MTDPHSTGALRVALLLSTEFFEEFYGRHLGLTRGAYLQSYRNDWSWDWVEMLGTADVAASIYVPTTGAGESAITPDGVRVRFLPLDVRARPWIHAPVLRRSPPGRWVAQAALASAFLAPLRSALSEDRIDVLCIQEYWTGRFDVLTRAVDVPIVAVDQGLPDHRELKWLKRGSFARCAGAITQTEREASALRRWGAPATRVPNGVRADFYSPADAHEDDGGRRIVCVGRLHDAQKRFGDVIRALALLDPDEGWTLEIAGVGPDEAMMRSLATELGVADRTRFLGFVGDRETLRELYRSATVVALPSAWEGLPMTLLEAMSCGAAVVGSDIPAISEVIEDRRTGLLVGVGDQQGLAQALQTAGEHRAKLGAAARTEIVETFDQAVVGPRLRSFLAQARTSTTSVAR